MTYYTILHKSHTVRLYRSADDVARFLHVNGVCLYTTEALSKDAILGLITGNNCPVYFTDSPETHYWVWIVQRHEVNE